MAERAREIKTKELSDGRYDALCQVRNYNIEAKEDKEPFVRNLEAELRNYRQKIAKGQMIPITKRLLGKLCEAILDYVYEENGTVQHNNSSKLIAITASDVEKFEELGRVAIELRAANKLAREQRTNSGRTNPNPKARRIVFQQRKG